MKDTREILPQLLMLIFSIMFIHMCTRSVPNPTNAVEDVVYDTLEDFNNDTWVPQSMPVMNPTAPCAQLNTNIDDFTVGLHINGPIHEVGIDSIYITATYPLPAVFEEQLFYKNDSFYSVQTLLHKVYGFEANILHHDVKVDSIYDFFVLLKNPNVFFDVNAWNRPALIFDFYVDNKITKRVVGLWEPYHIAPTSSMVYREIYAAVQSYSHDRLTLSWTSLTPNEVKGITDYYKDNCITGHLFNVHGLGIDSSVYRLMKDTLNWDIVRM